MNFEKRQLIGPKSHEAGWCLWFPSLAFSFLTLAGREPPFNSLKLCYESLSDKNKISLFQRCLTLNHLNDRNY